MSNSEMNENDKISQHLKDSLKSILTFIDCSADDVKECKDLITSYMSEKDEDNKRHLRKTLNNIFFKAYKECVLKSTETDKVPLIVQMFLLYGYMDEELAGIQNAIELCKLTAKYNTTKKTHTYSLYEWLMLIYNGQRNPSVNDMSVDYEQDLREKLRTKDITQGEYESLLRDRHKKLIYEMDNTFSVMKRVSGAPTRFLAPFSEEALEKPLSKAVLLNDGVEDTLGGIINIDVNLFSHEYTYANKEIGIENVRITREIKPDIILLPIIGSRPMMWQEIEGRNRQSAARFFYPKFYNGELREALIKCCGEYRWEYCKREQGARWQDISEPSLCSYYNNYIQTYRKNHQLSPEQKEKVKIQYNKFRHHIRDIFVDDYVKYIANEAEGNIRLNKVSRGIFIRFCILNKNIRAELVKNNLYTEFINVVNNKIAHEQKLVSLMKKRIQDNGAEMPEEIREHDMLINR